MSPTHNSKFILMLLLIGLALSQVASAVGACGTFNPSSGTCSGGKQQISCSQLDGTCCTAVSGCLLTCMGTDCVCTPRGGVPTVTCENYNDNEGACDTYGCAWTASGGAQPGSCTGSLTGKGYGLPCASDNDCATCLVCDAKAHKCTQRPGVCTTLPAAYVPPPPTKQQVGSGLSPQGAIENLTAGRTGGIGGAVAGSSTNIYKVGWFSDWKVMGLIGVAIVCSIIALAAMIGTAFNLPEVKAFANNELKQAVISALLIVSLVLLVAFFDQVARDAINGADLPISCTGGEPCYITSAKFYLQTLYDTGSEYAKNELRESIVNARRASYGYNLNLNKIYLLFAGMSIRFNAGDTLIAERHGALFSQVSKILSSIYSQKYFIDVVAYGIAPLFILLGILLRTFFFTRKLGGLMLAAAISLFIVYPLTFAFAWYTLNVTVYGDRTLAVADPNCPAECTGTYPIAFFTDSQSGQLVQFPTTQSIMRAGINRTNWASGGPDANGDGKADFPGLVACRDLTNINIPASVAANSCPDCPDYCRDVPFPTNMPGCNITKCSACNPGCKIVRQRLNCQTDPACAGKCPLNCRTKTPTENKCFSNESGGIIPASLATSCSGCDKYPAWCRFLKNDTSTIPATLKRVYGNDAVCAGIENDASCPSSCSYITTIGQDMECDNICSYTDPHGGGKTICPAECRVSQIYKQSWMSTYDIDPPNMSKACSMTPQIAAACKECSAHPECMVEVWGSPPTGCAAYPTNGNVPQLCLACPDYCRRDSFAKFFHQNSTVERSSGGTPVVCTPQYVNGMDCTSNGNPPACNSTCKMAQVPLICRSLDLTDANVSLCRHCPDNARFTVRYTKSGVCGGGGTSQEAPSGAYSVLLSQPGQEMASGSPSSQPLPAEAPAPGTIRLAGNNPPPQGVSITGSRISPASPSTNSQLFGYCNATAPSGGGDLLFNYKWYNGSAEFYSGSTTEPAVPGQESQVDYIVQPSSLAAGQAWKLSCQGVQGAQSSSWLNSTAVTIQAPQGEPPCTVTNSPLYLQSQYNCSASACGGACFGPVVNLPNESVNAGCKDAIISGCPYGCRVMGLDSYLNASCNTLACSTMRQQYPVCFVNVAQTWPVCSEYMGNGPASCHSTVCLPYSSQSSCASQPGCSWDNAKHICDNSACTSVHLQSACTGVECGWVYTANNVKIGDRALPYDIRAGCRQCPEQCRIDNYTGSCGVANNGNSNDYVDCSLSKCPQVCRIGEPQPQNGHDECQPYPDTAGESCKDCPALCRRQSDLLSSIAGCPASCQLTSGTTNGCADECRLDNPPKRACEGCFDCNMDCTYYPAIRTDCSDICSDEALAGPVNIEPNDFVKSLPGAKTSDNGMGARNVGVLYIPAVVLPLFCIVIVIAFIRILSPILGGDIEIPGLGKII